MIMDTLIIVTAISTTVMTTCTTIMSIPVDTNIYPINTTMIMVIAMGTMKGISLP